MKITELLKAACELNDVSSLLDHATRDLDASMSDEDLMSLHARVAGLLKPVKTLERRLRDLVLRRSFSYAEGSLQRGSKRAVIPSLGLSAKATFGVKAHVEFDEDDRQLAMMAMGDYFDLIFQPQLKHSLNRKAYNELTAENKAFVNKFITYKSETPSVTYEAVDIGEERPQ